MEMTQLNTRIPCNLKASGDAVLARFGRTASDVMRCVWQYMADHQDLPECAKPQMNDEKRNTRISVLLLMRGLPWWRSLLRGMARA